MSNIHRLHEGENDPPPPPNRPQDPGRDNRNMQEPLLGKPDFGEDKLPRNETFSDFVHINFCPYFRWDSFIGVISIFEITIYLLCLAMGLSNSEFLAPLSQTVEAFGMKDPYKMKQGELFRWIMPTFLHLGLMHIFFNVFCQIIIGSILEYKLQIARTAMVYMLSSLGGILLSALLSNDRGAGASCAVFGLIGALIGYLILNWTILEPQRETRNKITIICVFIILINLFFGVGNAQLDNVGHVGGAISGLFLGIAYGKDLGQRTSMPIVKVVSIFVLAAFYIGGFLLFYTVRNPYQN